MKPKIFEVGLHAMRCIFGVKILQKMFATGSPPRTLLRELTTLSIPFSRLGIGMTLPIPPVDAFGILSRCFDLLDSLAKSSRYDTILKPDTN